MAAAKELQKRAPKGKARLEMEGDGKTLSVQLDRAGFHRLIQTLERLAETGEAQSFEKSGRGPGKSRGDAAQKKTHPQKLVFRLMDE